MNELHAAIDRLTRWLPRERAVACVMGRTHSGKTTVCNHLVDVGFTVCRPGQWIRNKLKAGSLAVPAGKVGMDVPVWDEEVMDYVSQFFDPEVSRSVVIDGFPRNDRQLAWIIGQCNAAGYNLRLVYVDALDEVRMRRARSSADKWDQDHFASRDADEAERFLPLMRKLRDYLKEMRTFTIWNNE